MEVGGRVETIQTTALLKTAQNNAKRTNYIKAKINNTQQNCKCRLCGDRNKTVNHIISECRKLAQKEYKTGHNWVMKVIHWELCKKLKFHHSTKRYMHKRESVLGNEMDKFLLHFEIKTDHLISANNQT